MLKAKLSKKFRIVGGVVAVAAASAALLVVARTSDTSSLVTESRARLRQSAPVHPAPRVFNITGIHVNHLDTLTEPPKGAAKVAGKPASGAGRGLASLAAPVPSPEPAVAPEKTETAP